MVQVATARIVGVAWWRWLVAFARAPRITSYVFAAESYAAPATAPLVVLPARARPVALPIPGPGMRSSR